MNIETQSVDAEGRGDHDQRDERADTPGVEMKRPRLGETHRKAVKNRIAASLFGLDPAPVLIGRFEVFKQIGAGGMGVVFRARDPELDREVALKLLHPGVLGEQQQRSRLLREALALARLSHPNVVQLYEVGNHEEGLFLAMEYVRGRSLRRWQDEAAPSWRAIVRAYAQAARGLAAAHEVGLVHRDFKPDNCIIDGGGRVRVLDFGLVRETTEEGVTFESSGAEVAGRRSSGELQRRLTQTDKILGTPAYMAPEQLFGRPVDARADQFSFCVALFEALYGERPYPGEASEELAEAYVQGRVRWPAEASRRPPGVRRALLRGLAVDSRARWPSMSGLASELERLIAPRGWRWLGGAAGLAVGLAAAGFGLARSSGDDPCEGAPAKLEEVWDESRSLEIEHALLSTDLPYAPEVMDRVRASLNEYAGAWITQHIDACEATAVRREQSAEIMDLRMRCLRRARLELVTTTDVLMTADADVVRNTHELLARLRPPSQCADVELLQAESRPPVPSDAARVSVIRKSLALVSAQRRAGRYGEARAALERAQGQLEGVRYEPVRAEVSLERGLLLEVLGDYEGSQAALKQALKSASRLHQWRELQRAANALMRVIGYRQRRFAEGLQYRELALGLASHEPLTLASTLRDIAAVLLAKGEVAAAKPLVQRALTLIGRTKGPEDLHIIQSRQLLANILVKTGEYGRAETELRRALRVARDALGAEHPDLASLHGSLAATFVFRGMGDRAEQEIRRAVDLKTPALGSDHPEVLTLCGHLATILSTQGRLDEAEQEHRRVLDLRRKVLGPAHSSVAESHNNLAVVLDKQGRFDEAEVEHRRALAIREPALGPEHRLVATSRFNLAWVLVEQQRLSEARQFAELAWARNQRGDIPIEDRAASAFVLACSLWSDPEQRPRAVALAERSREAYLQVRSLSEEVTQQLDAVEAWLVEHRTP